MISSLCLQISTFLNTEIAQSVKYLLTSIRTPPQLDFNAHIKKKKKGLVACVYVPSAREDLLDNMPNLQALGPSERSYLKNKVFCN